MASFRFLPLCAALGGLMLSSAASAAHSSAEEDEMAQMRAECMALHEEMKAAMIEGGMKMDTGKASPENMAKYERCMEAVPEMREVCMEAMPNMPEMCR